jgi:hypothetical protein
MAFMGEESWKAGLSGFQLSKVTDLETQLTRTKKERSEKLMQFEILQQTLEKQKRKVIHLFEVQSISFGLNYCPL